MECFEIAIQMVVSPRTAEDLNEAGDDDEEAKSKNPTGVIKHHLMIKMATVLKVQLHLNVNVNECEITS